MKVLLTLGLLFYVSGCVELDVLQQTGLIAPNIRATSGEPEIEEIETNGNGVHVVGNHGGGRIIDVEAERQRLLNWGGPVRIEGYCNSACVILTTLPNACLESDATIGFHSSNINFGPVGNSQIAKYLRGGVLEKFLAEWQYVPYTEIHHIWGRRYVALDPETNLCS